ncbi:hypothetical protein AB0N24_25615 [Arthrobacter sp. NPDC093128]|uniref:hypothetical protein n=1 Tax=Arthrobacter sp. NPDC093128 TaxID=3154979 RepID=UPI00341B77D2
MAITGDDQDAKTQVARFVHAIGYDTLDIGPLTNGWRHEAGTPVNMLPYATSAPASVKAEEFEEWLHTAPTVRVTADRVRDLTDATTRTGRVGGTSSDWRGVLVADPAHP